MEKLHVRTFQFNFPSNQCLDLVESRQILVAENSEYMPGHGSLIWAGSFVFAYSVLSSMKEAFEGKKVLDLGTGCGLTSMAIAFSGGKCVSTELPASVPHLERNFELNELKSIRPSDISLLGSIDDLPPGSCFAQSLDWTLPASLGNVNPFPSRTFDVIVGCEVVYHEPILIPLVNTIDYHLSENGVVYLVSARHRHCYLHFFQLMMDLGFEMSTSLLPPPNFKMLSHPSNPPLPDPPGKITTTTSSISPPPSSCSSPPPSLSEEECCCTFTQSEEMSVGWFSEGEFIYDVDKLILVTCRRRKK